MKSARILTLAVFCSGLVPQARAGSAGGEPFDFLSLDAGARPSAMGGAYTALAWDSNALHYNPAGLGMVRRHELTFMHNQHFQGTSHEYLGAALRQGVGADLALVRYPDTARTTYANPGGTLGNYGSSDGSVALGFGRRVTESASLGIAFKYAREVIDVQAINAYAFDLGALYAMPQIPRLTLGLSIQNIGPDTRFDQAEGNNPREKLPLNIRAGAAYRFSWLGAEHAAALDLIKQRSLDTVAAVGLESVVYRGLALRLGFNSRNSADLGLTAGLGWTYRDLSVDYAVVPFGDLGYSHRASFTVRWGEAEDPPEPKARAVAAADLPPAPRAPPPMTPESLFDKAEEAAAAGDADGARAALAAAAAMLGPQDPRRMRYYQRMGHLHYLSRDLAKAEASFYEGLSLAQSLGLRGEHVADAFAGLGTCLLDEGNVPYALRFFEKALEAGPSPATARDISARLHRIKELQKRR